MLQCLAHSYAEYHAMLPPDKRGAHSLVLALRTATLRHEFLQGLLEHNVLRRGQVVFGGRLPEHLLRLKRRWCNDRG